jgi:hypothetical protein
MVDLIGVKKTAKRFGVTERTIKGWVKLGLPSRRAEQVSAAVRRSERASRAAATTRLYREKGFTTLKSFSDVDKLIGKEPGYSRERWKERKQWWEEHRPYEHLAKRIKLLKTKDGKIFYVNGDKILWRAYTVDGKLFWTQATYLEGYKNSEAFIRMYESLQGRDVRIIF